MNKWEWCLSFLLAFAVIFLTGLYFQQFQPYQLGLKFLKDKNYSSAKEEFLHILGKNPFLFPARLNLALVESLQKNIPNAMGEYQVVAEDSPDKEERFQAQFNTAILQFLSGKIPASLDHYQQALEETPESMEVKVNIELMMLAHEQEQKQQQQEQEEQEQEKQNKDSKDGSEQTVQEMKEEQGEEKMKEKMNEDQIQFIFKELEERERKLRSRLQDQEGKRRRGKSW
ncbi:MAG: hypothetical protein OXK80_02810 [Bdellovibrionales bacterium]|nr:hypothetical protein [Bdellovibrionales bacterium]